MRARLQLVRVLQLFDPVGFFGFKAGDLLLDLKAFFIFFVNLSYQLEALLLALKFLFSLPLFNLFLFFGTDHLFHRLRPHFFLFFLHSDHLFVLQTLFFQSCSFLGVD